MATPPVSTVVNETHRFLVLEQLEAVNYPQDGLLLLEPEGRNTAPAIALAALAASQNQHDALLLVLPADHLIRPNQEFINTVKAAIPAAENDFLITFGVRPSSAHTGYGYIKAHEAVSEQLPGVLNVEAFVEKPSADLAQAYLESGAYSWNSGVFLFKASRYLKALRQHCPEILEACEAAFQQRQTDGRFTRVGQQAFLSCTNRPVRDYPKYVPKRQLL